MNKKEENSRTVCTARLLISPISFHLWLYCVRKRLDATIIHSKLYEKLLTMAEMGNKFRISLISDISYLWRIATIRDRWSFYVTLLLQTALTLHATGNIILWYNVRRGNHTFMEFNTICKKNANHIVLNLLIVFNAR